MKAYALISFVTLLMAGASTAMAAQKAPTPRENSFQSKLDDATRPNQVNEVFQHLYFPEFNLSGDLTNPSEVRRLRADIRDYKIDCFVVLSYGWMNREDEAQKNYQDNLTKYLTFLQTATPNWNLDSAKRSMAHTATICVVWDSVARLDTPLRDLLTADYTIRWLMTPFNNVTTVATLWAKGSQADRIGGTGLRSVLNVVQKDVNNRGNIFLIGHSFGCRIASAAVQSHGRFQYVPAHPILPGVKGMLLIQPALAANAFDLPQVPDFPLVVTQTVYDHANGGLFPIAGLPLNLSTSRLGSSVFRDMARARGKDTTAARVTEDLASAASAIAEGPYGWLFSYPFSQIDRLNRPDKYVADTLAQLPVVQVPVIELGRALDAKQQNGGNGKKEGAAVSSAALSSDTGKHKGAFDFGWLYESAGRGPMLDEHPFNPIKTDPGHTRFMKYEDRGTEWLEPGVTFLDCSKVLSKSGLYKYTVRNKNGGYDSVGVDYEKNRALNYTLGWLDPVGAHTSITEDGIFCLIHDLILNGSAKEKKGSCRKPGS